MTAATVEGAPPRRGARLYFGATTVAQVCALLRYVVLARVLGPEQLGLAATLMLTASFFELATETGADRFLIQSRDGDEPAVQGLVQLVTMVRGILIAGLLAILAWPISRLYRAPELVGGLLALAIPPLINGFGHLDLRRRQRELDFRPEGTALIVMETLSLIATVVAALVTRNFTAVVYGLLVRAIAAVAVSHVLSQRRFVITLDRSHLTELAKFSGPLMLNGLLLFMGSQSDRVIVGSMLGVKDLGLYSAMILLIYYPSSTLMRYLHVMYLPLVASGRAAHQRQAAASLLGGQFIFLASLMATGFTFTMPVVIPLLYGDRYAQSLLTLAVIGVLQSSRFLLMWPTIVATGDGRSTVVLATNVVRILGIPTAIFGAWFTGRLEGLVGGFALGEWAAVATGLAMTRGLNGRTPGAAGRLVTFMAASILLIAWAAALTTQAGQVEKVLTVATVLLTWWILQRERSTVKQSLQLLRQVTLRAGKPEPAAGPRIEEASDLS